MALKVAKKEEKKDEEGDAEMLEDDTTSAQDPVTRLFEIELESTTSNAESDAEPE